MMIPLQRPAINMLDMLPAPIRDRDPARAGFRATLAQAGIYPIPAFDIPLAGIELVKIDAVLRIDHIVELGVQPLTDKSSRILIVIEIGQSRRIIELRLVVLR